MFFGRIWGRGGFIPSWRSYAAYAGIIALALLAIEFNVLNLFPGNSPGNLLLAVPAFYVVVALIFVVTDAGIALWRMLPARSKRKPKSRAKAPRKKAEPRRS